MILGFHEFDAILGLDWLFRHKVVVDCHSRMVRLVTKSSDQVSISRVVHDMKCELISTVSAKKRVLHCVDANLAYIMNIMVVKKDFKQVIIVNQFPYVFQKELLRVSLDRQVEFPLKIALGTAPISYAPCRMAPLELKELKVRL